MKELLQTRLELLAENRKVARKAWKWERYEMQVCCAALSAMHGEKVDAQALDACKKLLKGQAGPFSAFRSTVRPIICGQLAMAERPDELITSALETYKYLRDEFHASDYLPLAAMALAQNGDPTRKDELAHKTRDIYERMRSNHRLLTGSEDAAVCALMALSPTDPEVLLADAETCFARLKSEKHISSNQVQAISHFMALAGGNMQEHCDRFVALKKAFADAGHKWGQWHDLPVLALLSMTGEDPAVLVRETVEADEYLKKTKAIGSAWTIEKRQRVMYAALMVLSTYSTALADTVAAADAVIFEVLVQQAVCTAIAISIAASSISSGSSH